MTEWQLAVESAFQESDRAQLEREKREMQLFLVGLEGGELKATLVE